jgi:hypothetical protein
MSSESKNILWRTNIYRKYFVYKSESSCLTRKQEHILKDEHIPKVFGIWVWIFVSHQETKYILKDEQIPKVFCVWVWIFMSYQEARTYSERRTYTEGILYMSLNLCISPGSKNIFWRTKKYQRYFVYESEPPCPTRKQEHILKDEHIPKVFCI